MGHEVTAFSSAEDFEAEPVPVDCAIVDIRLPGLSGLELRERLRTQGEPPPVVLITGDSDRLARDVGCGVDTHCRPNPSMSAS
jgi:FixJ family two-component response regulator